MEELFSGVYKDKTVLVTGHTGFKGSWLCFWLEKLGAKVVGYSLDVPTEPNHLELLGLNIVSVKGDIRDLGSLHKVFEEHKPDIVFHLAAQALVRQSYKNPIETYETNIIGTLKVFEAVRANNTKAIVNITSDKAYENTESGYGYIEEDRLGGYDPYSSSKACAEILTASYRNSYFNLEEYKHTHNTLIASCRAGNVVGGGDWAYERLIPDIMLFASQNKKLSIRSPNSVRPWQHVLEPLSAYLQVGQKLLEEKVEFAQAWNFGPDENESLSVEDVVKTLQKYWSNIDYKIDSSFDMPYEAKLLRLNCSKAYTLLKWRSVWDSETTFKKTVEWYKSFYDEKTKSVCTEDDLKTYIADAKKKGIEWTKS